MQDMRDKNMVSYRFIDPSVQDDQPGVNRFPFEVRRNTDDQSVSFKLQIPSSE